MKEKYYTPTIEEFRVGFEFEMRNSSDDRNYDWEKCQLKPDFTCELDEDFDSYQLMSDLKNGFIRVKYLDEEDILSLGFEKKYDHPFAPALYCITSDEFYINYDADGNYTEIIDKGKPDEFLFFGRIKNKSELKYILSIIN